jgi:hypothetical protein
LLILISTANSGLLNPDREGFTASSGFNTTPVSRRNRLFKLENAENYYLTVYLPSAIGIYFFA